MVTADAQGLRAAFTPLGLGDVDGQSMGIAVWLASASERRAIWLKEWLLKKCEFVQIPIWFAARPLGVEEPPPCDGCTVEEGSRKLTEGKATVASEVITKGSIPILEWARINPLSSDRASPEVIVERDIHSIPPVKPNVVIVADTLVQDPFDHFLPVGKPKDSTAAESMITNLSGEHHRVWSPTAILYSEEILGLETSLFGEGKGHQLETDEDTRPYAFETPSGWKGVLWQESARVSVDRLTVDEIGALVESGSWIGKAGGYDLAGAMGSHARLVSGEEICVLGLSMKAMIHLAMLVNPQRN